MRIAIVTGASSGLGKEFVKLLGEQKQYDEIWVIARREDRLCALQKTTTTKIRPIPLDLKKKQSIRELRTLFEEERPKVCMLINAAGYGRIGGVDEIALEDAEGMVDLNCRAVVAITQVVIPYMTKGARIMQISSTSAFQPFQYLNIYAASKAFLYSYSRALRVELRSKKISVTVVCPYWIKDTEFIGTAQKSEEVDRIHSFPFASEEKRVARRAVTDTMNRFAVSTPGPICTMHRFISKIVPDGLMMAGWELLRRL